MKFIFIKSAITFFIYFYKFVNCEPSVSNLILNKCCEVSEYFNKNVNDDGSCVVVKKDNSSKIWELPTALFHEIDGLNLTEDQIQIQKFEIKRPKCIGKSKIYRRLYPGHLTLSYENIFVFIDNSEKDINNETESFVAHKNEFCIDRSESNEFIVELCIPNCDPRIDSENTKKKSKGLESPSTCLMKCCLPHQILDLINFSCVDVQHDTNFYHPIFNPSEMLYVSEGKEDQESIKLKETSSQALVSKIGLPRCQIGSYEVDFRDKNGWKSVSLLSSGNLILETNEGKKIKISQDQFCIDGILDEAHSDNVISRKIDKIYDQFALVCFELEPPEGIDVLEKYRPILFPTLTGISSIFLLFTSIIYIVLWKELHLPGFLQFSYTNTLFVAFSLLTIVQLWTEQIHHLGGQYCRIVGYTLHATFLSCFFWLTSMNIDLWCSFRNTPMTTGFGRSRGRRRYFAFAMFSTIIPLGVTLTAVFVDDMNRNSETPENSVVSTEIGENSCALNIRNKMAQLYYFYGVVGLLLVVNLLFFFCTVLCLRERQRETKFARQSTANDSDMQRFRLFTRLFFIMGILWIFELISFLAGFLNLDPNIQLIFLATDCLNALQGVGVFVMFVWKRHTWKQLRKKYRKVMRLDSRTSLMGPNTIKSSLKSSTKSGSVCSKTTSPTSPTSPN